MLYRKSFHQREICNHSKNEGRKRPIEHLPCVSANAREATKPVRLPNSASEKISGILREVFNYWKQRKGRVCLEDKL